LHFFVSMDFGLLNFLFFDHEVRAYVRNLTF